MKKYKLWVHLEEITIDEDGKDIDYKSMDGEYLPVTLGEYSTANEANAIMNQIEKDYLASN